MKILAIDTSSNLCSVALLEDTTLIKKIVLDNGLTHSETLMPTVKKIFDDTNLKLENIDLIVSDIGPGSFTGIRIGVATCKAFSDSLNIPTIGIYSLEVLAYNTKKEGLICSTIDCKNDNCYFALYSLKNGEYQVVEEPSAKSNIEVLNLLNSKYNTKEITFVGDGITSQKLNEQNKLQTNFNFEADQLLNIENLGIAGYKKFIKNNHTGENILPAYLKKPQAQIQLEKKENI